VLDDVGEGTAVTGHPPAERPAGIELHGAEPTAARGDRARAGGQANGERVSEGMGRIG
jgi:hypothetical protein